MPDRVVRALAGTVLARPWFDRAGLFALRHWFFPASRLWAAAHEAEGDVSRFFPAVPMPARLDTSQRLARALARFEAARVSAAAIDEIWERTFFGPNASSPEKRAAVEASRRQLAHAHNATRRHFRFLIGPDVPRVKLEIATPDEVAAVYGAAQTDVTPFTRAPAVQPAVEVSRKIETAAGYDHWLRFRSPSRRVDDIVYARVHEPGGISDPPTIIFGHGICVEFDQWQGLIDECEALVRLGFRVVRPEAPWHGRRRLAPEFGGEHLISAFPMGALDAVFAAVQEWAVLARWARETSRGPLAFGGTSLGAMTSQFAADRAADWPAELRPGALLLLTHTQNLTHAVMTGALADLWMSRADAEAKGWSEDLAREYLILLEPRRPLCVPSSHIVSVLGRRDAVLPFASGRRLVEEWCVPHDNVFIWDRGHFSVPMTLAKDDAPLKRFATVVAALQR